MSISKPQSAEELISYVKAKLGSPYYQVEISQEQFEMIVDDALRFARDYIYDMTQGGLHILSTSAGVNEYTLPENIYAVTDILDRSVYDQFFLRFPTRDRSAEEISFVMSVTSQSRGGAMSDMMFGLQNLNFFRDQFLPRNMWNYNFNTHKFRLISTPNSSATSTSVGMEYALLVEKLIDTDATGGSNVFSHFWILKYATALAKIQLGMNLTKYNITNLPGGLTLNAEQYKSEGTAEKDVLEKMAVEELYDIQKVSSVNWG